MDRRQAPAKKRPAGQLQRRRRRRPFMICTDSDDERYGQPYSGSPGERHIPSNEVECGRIKLWGPYTVDELNSAYDSSAGKANLEKDDCTVRSPDRES